MQNAPWQLNCVVGDKEIGSKFSCDVSVQKLKLVFYFDKYVCIVWQHISLYQIEGYLIVSIVISMITSDFLH